MTGTVDCVRFVLFVFIVCHFKLAETHPATEFTKHAVIKPRIYHRREKRQIFTTKEETGRHIHHITVDYYLERKKTILDLQLNRDLIPKGYFQRYQKDGKDVVNKPTEEEIELCYYNGVVRGIPNSWVAISTCNDTLQGAIFDGSDMYFMHAVNDIHYLYRHSDFAPNNKTSGYHGYSNDEHHHITEDHEFNRILRNRRSSKPILRGPYNANNQSRYVELVLVVDNRIYIELGKNKKRVEQHCKEIANIINGMFSQLNIYIALVGVVIWTERDEINISKKGGDTLTNFLQYRQRKLIKDHPHHDNAQLLTNVSFNNGSILGLSFPGTICSYKYSGGINTDHPKILDWVAATIAHEMGHSLGMKHDTSECTCPEKHCIMYESDSHVLHWSSCSSKYLAQAFERGKHNCLRNKPVALFDSPVCGNGFVESGEQCDCGLPHNCDNTCCNAATCMLHKNASCATGECCDLSTCKAKNAGTLCRSADYECDLPEYCTGQSEYCPDDIYKMDSETCGGGKAYCYHGFCRTRSDQCKLVWGNNGTSSDDKCYKHNTEGRISGDCGYNKLNQIYSKCQDEDVLCGRLHCEHSKRGWPLKFAMKSAFKSSWTTNFSCYTAVVNLVVDPGLVPNGAKCGDGKMCVNQKCMPVDRVRVMSESCSNNCSGNGVCNSLGQCHCKTGFAPPRCNFPGPGGSYNSGPATDPNAHTVFVTAMIIFFLGVIPGFALLAFVASYMRRKFMWKKSPSTYVTRIFTKCSDLVLSTYKCVGNRKNNVPTISQHVPDAYSGSLRNLEIKQTGLIYTTNANMINNSSNINPPCTSDRHRFSLKNPKGLKLNTDVKYSKGEDPTPQTLETVCIDDVGPVSVANLKTYFEQNDS